MVKLRVVRRGNHTNLVECLICFTDSCKQLILYNDCDGL